VSTTRRRRWMDMLRRTARDRTTGPQRPALEDASLWEAHDRALEASSASTDGAEQITAALTRQQTLIESAGERAGFVAGRSESLTTTAARVSDSFERLGVVALNAGLEGARVGDPHGRSLLLLSEEIRANVMRGSEAARELTTSLENVSESAGELRKQVDGLKGDIASVRQQASQLKTHAQKASTALDSLSDRLKAATGIDPEVARTLTVAADHAKGLSNALSRLHSAQLRMVLEALTPFTEPLVRVLEGPDGDGGAASERGESDDKGT